MAELTSGTMKEAHFSKGMEVEVSSDEEGLRGSWYTATVLRSKSTKKKYMVQYHNLISEVDASKALIEFVDSSHVRPRPPREIDREFGLHEEVDAFHNDGWWAGVICKVLHESSKYVVHFHFSKEEIEFERLDLRVHMDWIDGKWVPAKKQDLDETNFVNQEEFLQAINSAHISEVATLVNRPGDAGEKAREISPFAATVSISKKRKKLSHQVKGHLSLSCKRIEGIQCPVVCGASTMGFKALSVVEAQDDTIIEAMEGAKTTAIGLPSLNVFGIDDPLCTIYKQCEGNDLRRIQEHSQLKNFVPQYPRRKRSDLQQQKVEGREAKGMRIPLRRSSRPRIRYRDPNAQTRDMIDLTLDEPRPQRTGLPFVKSSQLWTVIESMEAFHMMPQQPHFNPLKRYCEEQREGMAIGHMVTFANLVANTCKSQLEESRDLFQKRLSTLVDLERHGFDVQQVRARLENLLRIKDGQVQVYEKTSTIVGKIQETNSEIDRLDVQIEEIQAQIKVKIKELVEWEQSRIMLDRRRVSAVTKIAKLRMEVQEEARKIIDDFTSIATAPW